MAAHEHAARAQLRDCVSRRHDTSDVNPLGLTTLDNLASTARAARLNSVRSRTGFQLSTRHLTPELSRRDAPTPVASLAMRDKLIPVGLSDLLGDALRPRRAPYGNLSPRAFLQAASSPAELNLLRFRLLQRASGDHSA
jgi:hypothetical protein